MSLGINVPRNKCRRNKSLAGINVAGKNVVGIYVICHLGINVVQSGKELISYING